MARLEPLEPQRIGGVFRESAPAGIRLALRLSGRLRAVRRRTARAPADERTWSLTAKTKILLISLGSCGVLLGLAEAAGALGPSSGDGRRWALDYLFTGDTELGGASLALFQDPAGLVILAVVFVTPVFCCQQVQAIAAFVQMNERNGGTEKLLDEEVRRLNDLVRQTNRWFRWLGRWWVSLALLLAMASGTLLLYRYVDSYGLMETWNPTDVSDTAWRTAVYDGWWGNWHRHPELAVALCVAGTHAFYVLSKQLVMGVVFTVYLYRSDLLGFGVTPNMRYDSDGFQGLRPLRQFILWTYGSALAHMIGLLVLFMIWLPARPWMVFILLVVMLVDMLVIVYPSSIGYHSALTVKKDHVRYLYDHEPPGDTRNAAIAQVWSKPVLPVTTRKATTGIFLYLLAPAIPALVPLLFR